MKEEMTSVRGDLHDEYHIFVPQANRKVHPITFNWIRLIHHDLH